MEILGKTVTQLRSLIEAKKLSKKEIFEYFLNRAKKHNEKLNAFLSLIDYESEINNSVTVQGEDALEGIPVAVKDNFNTKNVRTTAASKVLRNFVPPFNATVVRKILKKGGKILGKTNMDAWAHGSSTETSFFGPTKNPWDLSRVPGGSSGGSAAAVSAYLSPVAIGSETGGSIRQPAAWCGVIGFKPSYGRVSRFGLIAMASSTDSPGVLSLSVEDAALMLGVLAGKDKYDATTSSKDVPNYEEMLQADRKMVIGVAEDYLKEVDDSIKKAFEKVVAVFKKNGHSIKKIKLLDPKYAISVYTIIQRAEVSSNLARFDGIRYGEGRDSFGKEAKKRIMLGSYVLSEGYYDAYYLQAQKVRTKIIQDFSTAFKDVDLILSPVVPSVAMRLGEYKKYPFFGELIDRFNEPAAVAGLPAISFPVGLDKEELPLALQLIGNLFEEERVLQGAYFLEKKTNFFDVIKKGVERWKD